MQSLLKSFSDLMDKKFEKLDHQNKESLEILRSEVDNRNEAFNKQLDELRKEFFNYNYDGMASCTGEGFDAGANDDDWLPRVGEGENLDSDMSHPPPIEELPINCGASTSTFADPIITSGGMSSVNMLMYISCI